MAGPTGPAGDGEYLVKQGECLASIAAARGYFWETLWKHPKNAALKNAREDPFELLPGDRVHIPVLRVKEETAGSEACHKFRRKGVPSHIDVTLMFMGLPVADKRYVADVDGNISEGSTDGKGRVKIPIAPGAQSAAISVGSGPDSRITYDIRIGGLDPITELTGVQGRLRNLGYHCEATGIMDDDTVRAIRSFQQDQKIEVTGVFDDKTRDKLKRVHKS
jgi:hypothetical protein